MIFQIKIRNVNNQTALQEVSQNKPFQSNAWFHNEVGSHWEMKNAVFEWKFKIISLKSLIVVTKCQSIGQKIEISKKFYL